MSSEYLIDMRDVTKIFGPDPSAALDMLAQGRSKSDVQSETGHIIGLNQVSVAVEKGEIFVVMGLSGSGKSTLIRHVNRLIEPTSGEIFVQGHDVLSMTDEELREFRRARTAMVFQKFGLLPHRSVIDNVAYGLEVRGVEKDERRKTAAQWIETVGLSGYEESRPFELSGGQQQRVGLARALAMDTEILLMDEAFSALDPLIRSGMQDQLLSLQKDLHKTILFITHDFDEAIKIGDRIAVLNDGALVQTDKPQDIVLKPADDYVAEFVADVNKMRVIKVAAIMEKGTDGDYPVAVPATSRCEDVLPLFSEHEWVAVHDEEGRHVGRISADRVINAIARYTPAERVAGVDNTNGQNG